MPPILPLPDADWPTELAHMKDGFAGQLNVYRTMANHPSLLKAWADLRDHVVLKSNLTQQQSEVAILRTGHRMNAPYEWAHHVVRARKCAMSDARIATMRGPIADMHQEDAIIAKAVDELVSNSKLTPAVREPLEAYVGITGTLDVMATVGFYTTLSYIVNSFDVPIDDNIIRALDTQPFTD